MKHGFWAGVRVCSKGSPALLLPATFEAAWCPCVLQLGSLQPLLSPPVLQIRSEHAHTSTLWLHQHSASEDLILKALMAWSVWAPECCGRGYSSKRRGLWNLWRQVQNRNMALCWLDLCEEGGHHQEQCCHGESKGRFFGGKRFLQWTCPVPGGCHASAAVTRQECPCCKRFQWLVFAFGLQWRAQGTNTAQSHLSPGIEPIAPGVCSGTYQQQEKSWISFCCDAVQEKLWEVRSVIELLDECCFLLSCLPSHSCLLLLWLNGGSHDYIRHCSWLFTK